MKWLLLSSATEIKVLNCSNHRQAQPARSHNQDGAGGERVPGHGSTRGCSCALVLLCYAGISFWSSVMLQLFHRSYGLCFEALCWQARGGRVPAAKKPLGNGGEPSSPFPVGLSRWMLHSIHHCCSKSPSPPPFLAAFLWTTNTPRPELHPTKEQHFGDLVLPPSAGHWTLPRGRDRHHGHGKCCSPELLNSHVGGSRSGKSNQTLCHC